MKYSFYLVVVLLFIISLNYFYNFDINSTSSPSPASPEKKNLYKGYDAHQVQPLPLESRQQVKKVALGKRLFHEPRLSHDNTISCASCHVLRKGGTDRMPVSIGIGGAIGLINSPTVFNSGFNFRQFWDGRAKTLEQQAAGPVHNPIEMNSNWKEVIAKLQDDSEYPLLFNELYADGISADAIADLLATFQRSLITPNSYFDQYLRGNKEILTANELKGFRLFKDYGCISCHQGINLGGNMFQKFGVIEDYFEGRTLTKADLGRFNVTGLEEDRHVFKVPGLRNVAVTAPYFHDASAKDLKQVVVSMGRHQLGRDLSQEDINSLVAFLKTLTGQWNGVFLQ